MEISRQMCAVCACLILSLTTPFSAAFAATVSLDPIRIGVTSRGGINQGPSDYVGIYSTYADVFKFHYVFDLSSLSTAQIDVNSVQLTFDGGVVDSGTSELLTIGSFDGNISTLLTDYRVTGPLNRSLYPQLVARSYGDLTLPASSTLTGPLTVSFNNTGVGDVEAAANMGGLTLFAVGGSLGIPNYILNTTRLFYPGDPTLTIDYNEVALSTPIPPALYLFGSGLLGLAGIARRKKAG